MAFLLTNASDACARFANAVASSKMPSLQLPASPWLSLGGNGYGVGGHFVTALEQCVWRDDEARTFGWNWTRGHTTPVCAPGQTCKAAECFADFSLASVSTGQGPWTGTATVPSSAALPVNTTTLSRLIVSQNISWTFTDLKPGVDPPAIGNGTERRVRMIYDFFLTTVRPNGSNVASTITDEVTINMASNAEFPGSQPPGCIDAASRYGKVGNYGPIVRNAVWDGYNHWDYWYTDHHDAVPNTGSRFSSFRRVGSEVQNAQPPSEVDLLPFIEAVRKQWPGEEVGPWLGEVSIGTEIYDYSAGSVTFHKPFTVDAVVAREVGGDRVSS